MVRTEGPHEQIESFAVSTNCEWLTVATPNVNAFSMPKLLVWSLDKGKPQLTIQLDNRWGQKTDLAFSPGGRSLAIDQGSFIRILDLNSGAETMALGKPEFLSSRDAALAYRADGRFIARIFNYQLLPNKY
jgi:hypothetical protein